MKRALFSIIVVATFVLSAAWSHAALIVDQENSQGGGGLNIAVFSPMGQSFIPSQSNLAAIAYLGGSSTYLNIREDTITGNILYTTDYETPGLDGYTFFDIDPDLWLAVGETYVFEIVGTGMITRDPYLGDPYPNGGLYYQGGFYAGDDAVFRTYYDDAATSSVPVPAAVWLLGSSLLGLMGVKRKERS
ncbi:exported hypothetical protein [Desulfosarcina cetonica]|uniref:VPLPA-CTERM sorting domain-containing protein n=1 Tax=Desulfosarcina cetonica TaxID=90730 RepID=UPI0006CF72A6|nr:VPLPA-CTERM sorting domain-containing protein [Desulfosarcina cetonica]VTR71454.1 exported hypothetical protein [Desulfosarcina cetonica]